MPALYRKYRPQKFTDVVGQIQIVQTLQSAVLNNKPAHAYLFTGTRGVGKTTLARLFAKALNCQKQKSGEACLACDVCTSVANGTFLDLVEIDAASNTGVENVRELIEHVKFQPTQGAYKVFIIDEAHMLSKQAFNALLKTLEEPPAHVIFILATTEAHKVPVTIISRTQRFDFNALSFDLISKHLSFILKSEKQSLPDEIIKLISQQAGGSLRDALSLLDKVLALGPGLTSAEAQVLLGVTDFNTHVLLFESITSGQTQKIPQLFEEFVAQGLDFLILNKDFLEFLRQVLIVKIAGSASLTGISSENLQVLEQVTGNVAAPKIIFLIKLFLKAYKDGATSPSPELPMLLTSIEAAMATQARSQDVGQEKDRNPELVSTERVKAEVKPVVVESVISLADSGSTVIQEHLLENTIPDTTLTLEEVKIAWPAVIAKIKTVNSPLATLVKNSPLLSVEQGRIELQVKYRFHKEHLESKKHYALLCGVIAEVCGKNAGISVSVSQNEDSQVSPTEALGSVLQVFGGELVE